MPRIGQRPRWKQILCLECMACTHKRHIWMEGYVVLIIGIVGSPLWCIVCLMLSPCWCLKIRDSVQKRLQKRRGKPFGGIDIAKTNAAKQVSRLGRRRKSLSHLAGSDARAARPPLLRLPEEIRREIFSYLVQPAGELTVCCLSKEKRLVVVPRNMWHETRRDDSGITCESSLFAFLKTGHSVAPFEPREFFFRDMLVLAKINRDFYSEVITMLYRDNVFSFHPLPKFMQAGSIEHFLAFTNSIPAERLQDLGHIRLHPVFDVSYREKDQKYLVAYECDMKWKMLCERLKKMGNLMTLHVRVKIDYVIGCGILSVRLPVDGQSPENYVLSDLIGIQARNRFIVEVPFLKRAAGELPGAEFELREAEGAIDHIDEHLQIRR